MFHAIALRTVLPTLKSARKYNDAPRPPKIMVSSDDPAVCWEELAKIGGGRTLNLLNEGVLNGLPVFQTADWTYFIVEDKQTAREDKQTVHSRRLSANQIALMAAVLGVSNAGSDHLFEGPHATVTPDSLKKSFGLSKRPLDVDSVTTQIVAGLCENDAMLDMFLEEARSWVDRLMHMTAEDVRGAWSRYAAFVDCVQ